MNGRNFCLTQGHNTFHLFSSESFIILGFSSTSMIHFDLIFVYFWGEGHVDVQLFHHHLLKRQFLLNFLCTFVRYQPPIYVPSISGFSILPPLSISVFMLILNCVDYYYFIVDLKRGSARCPNLFFFFKKIFFLFLVLYICI